MGNSKNASGCADMTAYEARPGEIWTKKWSSDEEYLIVKNHGGFCTALKLTDAAVAAGMVVISRRKRYTDPAMVGYVFNSGLGEFVKELPTEQFEAVLRAVEDALGLTICQAITKVVEEEPEKEPLPACEDAEEAQATVEDPVNRPVHYTSGKYECIDVMVDVFGKEAVQWFCLLNAFKYNWRSKRKNGVEDIGKARWYMDKYLELCGDNGGDDDLRRSRMEILPVRCEDGGMRDGGAKTGTDAPTIRQM